MKSLYQPSAEFPTYADYRRAKQREARKAWKDRNAARYAEAENARRRAKYAEDEDYAKKQRARASATYRAAPEKTKARNKAYVAANRPTVTAYFREYNWIKHRRLSRATPAWADIDAIRAFYRDTREAGMEVDHIVPIAGERVCGLHVLNNLQMLSRSENARKGNTYAS